MSKTLEWVKFKTMLSIFWTTYTLASPHTTLGKFKIAPVWARPKSQTLNWLYFKGQLCLTHHEIQPYVHHSLSSVKLLGFQSSTTSSTQTIQMLCSNPKPLRPSPTLEYFSVPLRCLSIIGKFSWFLTPSLSVFALPEIWLLSGTQCSIYSQAAYLISFGGNLDILSWVRFASYIGQNPGFLNSFHLAQVRVSG